MKFKEKAMKIQTELKAPKNMYNSFGRYSYRNAEGICEAVKPFLKSENVVLTLTDDIVQIGERIYVKATATLADIETDEHISVSALARESETKKGMDDSQITGTASSYARKYALNGLFLLDDTKDADTDEYKNQTEKMEFKNPSVAEKKAMKSLMDKLGYSEETMLPEKSIEKLSGERFGEVMRKLTELDRKSDKS